MNGASGGGGGGSNVSSPVQLGTSLNVPDVGTLYYDYNSVSTASAPVRRSYAGTFDRLGLRLDVVDSSRAYNLEILVNGVVEDTVPIPVDTLGLTASINVVHSIGDDIAARLVRTSGTGISSFQLSTLELRSV